MKHILELDQSKIQELFNDIQLEYINLKIDQTCMIVKKIDGELKFYGREGRVELDEIKRIGQNTWNGAIQHFESVSDMIPEGITIHCEVFQDDLDTVIQYGVKPLNNIILSKIESLFPSENEVDYAMDLSREIQVSNFPIVIGETDVVNGLIALQNGIISYREFTEKHLKIYWQLHLQDYLAYGEEGFVFHFENGESYKLFNPDFSHDLKVKQKKNDAMFFKLSRMAWSMLEDHSEKIIEEYKSYYYNDDHTYVDFIESLMYMILDQYGLYIRSEMGEWSSGISHDIGKVNIQKEKIFNTETVDLTYTSDLFRIYLNGLRKHKKRRNKNTGLTTDRIKFINNFIDKITDILDSRENVQLFQGRFQPFHLGHYQMIEAAKNPVIVVVRGEKSSTDKERNPLDEVEQEVYIRECFPEAKIYFTMDGYLPNTIGVIESLQDVKVESVHCGKDRLEDYNDQLKRGEISNVSIVLENRVCSGSEIRQLIRAGYDFNYLLPEPLIKYEKLIEKRIKGN